MIKKILTSLIVFSLLAVGMWCLTFKVYYDTNDKVSNKLLLGDWPGALDSIKAYQENLLSYPIYNYSKLEKYRYRLFYLEGVVSHDVGNFEAANAAFRKAAKSQEVLIAATSRYNLAYYAMKENGLNKAQSLLNEVLMLSPNDIDAKINLELMLKKIQARQKIDLPKETEKKESIRPQAEPGEQWRLDVPDEDGEGGSGAPSGRSFL
jgi:tetratricopeptide (TPR) repeat protein